MALILRKSRALCVLYKVINARERPYLLSVKGDDRQQLNDLLRAYRSLDYAMYINSFLLVFEL